MQSTLDGAAQKWFSVLPIYIKSDWKRFTQEFFQKCLILKETNNIEEFYATKVESIKQLAVRNETLVLKRCMQDYKNTKKLESLMMTLTPQLRQEAKKESITSFLNPRCRFRLSKSSRKSTNHNKIGRSIKSKATICKQHPSHYFTNEQYS